MKKKIDPIQGYMFFDGKKLDGSLYFEEPMPPEHGEFVKVEVKVIKGSKSIKPAKSTKLVKTPCPCLKCGEELELTSDHHGEFYEHPENNCPLQYIQLLDERDIIKWNLNIKILYI